MNLGSAVASAFPKAERWLVALMRKESASSLVVAIGFNLAFLVFASLAGFERPWVNLDFVVAGAVLHKGRIGRIGAYFLVFIGLVYEIYRYVAGVYLFDLGQIFDVLGYVYAWPLGAVARIVALLAAAGVALIVFSRFAGRFRFRNSLLLALGGLVFLADAAHSTIRLSRLDGRQLVAGGDSRRLAYSSLGETLTLVTNYVQGGKRAGAPLKNVRSYELALAWRGKGDVLVISAESLGVFRDAAAQASFQRDIAKALGVGNVRFAAETSNGVTIDGELRVLCRTGLGNVDSSIAKARATCLPSLFADAGYTTLGAHAYFGDFYKRTQRYPSLGFQHTRFLREHQDRRCSGAFESGCDEDVLRDLLAAPDTGGKGRFLYQMTIETHLPEPACAGATGPLDAYRCRHLIYFGKLGQALRKVDRPTRVVVVGDHPPPFPGKDLRGAFRPHQVTLLSFDLEPAKG
jgi:hypothetical protein